MSQKLWEADSQTKTKSNLFEFEKHKQPELQKINKKVSSTLFLF